jgi:hypothetical protein
VTAKTMGLDIAKHVFQVHGADASEKAVLKKRLRAPPTDTFLRKYSDVWWPWKQRVALTTRSPSQADCTADRKAVSPTPAE